MNENAKKVMAAMSATGLARTSLENIEDVLEALAKLAPGVPDLIAAGALRQYAHNDGSPGVTFGYDKEIADRVLMGPPAPADEPEAEGYVDQDGEPPCEHCGSTRVFNGDDCGACTQPLATCMAGRDGECTHPLCPQLRDREPATSGRHCPLDTDDGGE